MVISEVASEDSRFLEREPSPFSEEFPDGCKIFFLRDYAYSVAAQVASTTNHNLSVILVVD
jgi:5'-3' exonuclease